MITSFKNREEAGRDLSERLYKKLKNKKDLLVVGLPRGGVVLADIVAQKLQAPLDVIIPRKIGAPDNPEYAIGALTLDSEPILSQAEKVRFPQHEIEMVIKKEVIEAERREKLFRRHLSKKDFTGRTIVLIDDGIATGFTIKAAIDECRRRGAKEIHVGVPVSAHEACKKISEDVSGFMCLYEPGYFMAIGQFYEMFEQVSDTQVIDILKKYD